jgi:type IV secretory pathway TrbL component
MHLDPSVVTLIQSNFLQHVGAAFGVVSHYALNLLYIFTALEVALFGIGWALQQEAGWGKLFFKVVKIGLIFTIIYNYPDLLSSIINSFATIAGMVVNKAKLDALIFNPTQIWQYGYDFGIFLLKSATEVSGMGLIIILTSLGMGVLLVFALLGIQVVVQLVGFYFVALVALILLPLGIFEPSRRMFDRSVQTVLQAGVRVMTVIVVIGVAALVWDGFKLEDMGEVMGNLNQSLGLFFSALLFLFLAIYLPRLAASVVGEIGGMQALNGGAGAGAGAGGTTIVGGEAPFAAPVGVGGSELVGMQAAVALEGGGAGAGMQGAAVGTGTEVSGGVGAASAFAVAGNGSSKSDLASHSILAKSDLGRGGGSGSGQATTLSPQVLKQLKDVLTKIAES